MLRKIIIFEIIGVFVAGGFAYSYYRDYESAYERNEADKKRLEELRYENSMIEKECGDLEKELASLREGIDMEILETWKRRVQQIQAELE